MIRAALNYAAQGYRVLPLDGKVPRLSGWVLKASKDTRQIERWWKFWPDTNIGIATGKESNLVVLDVDYKNGGLESLRKLQDVHGIEWFTGPQVLTGGGGYHFWFRYPQNTRVKSSAGLVAPGIDIRADGGQVVAPPSVHASGQVYRWVIPGEPKVMPPWLLQMVGTSTQLPTKRNTEWGSFFSDTVKSGGRNNAIATAAGFLASKGLSCDVIEPLILSWNRTNFDPPLSDEEVAATVLSIVRKEEAK